MNCLLRTRQSRRLATLFFQVEIAHDNGKLVARRGRKAVSLSVGVVAAGVEFLTRAGARDLRGDCLVAEGDPKKTVTSNFV